MKFKFSLPIVIGVGLLIFGGTSFFLSFLFDSLSLTFIGLGLTFWGILLLYIRPARYVRKDILDALLLNPLLSFNKLIGDLNPQGKGIYLPPRTLRELVDIVLFIPFEKDTIIPPVEEKLEDIIYVSNPHGIYLRPIGLDLAKKFEEELRIDWNRVNLNYLQKNLPRVLIEYLELAEDLEIEIKGNVVHVKIIQPVLKEVYSKLTNLGEKVGDPISSSIACALAKVCGRPIIIDSITLSSNSEVIEIYYRILENEEMYSILNHATNI